ncbi:glycine-rich cell wall structural protein-like [Bradysia coprophila]|uniref:glycine-rich cell wall structural protein-like n=1 Tax=Bradysia coprophila TaxID=38358 RepID=UPI00187DB172|nr:glycine-rich cell wall structural protein-like [Bradysia coprophila]
MKFIVLVVLAFIACAMAKPLDLDLGGHAQAAAGFAVGVVAVPVGGLGGGAAGLVTGGPKGALAAGAQGAHGGTNLAQKVGGQEPGYHGDRGHSSGGGLFGLF